jgi:hypothetical protein
VCLAAAEKYSTYLVNVQQDPGNAIYLSDDRSGISASINAPRYRFAHPIAYSSLILKISSCCG